MFACEPGQLCNIISGIRARGSIMGWKEILQIATDATRPHDDLRVLSMNFGEITMHEIKAHAYTYIAGQNRAAQDNAQMYHCLLNSLTVEGQAKVAIWEDDYMVRGEGSGPLLLKIIIRESDIDTNATIKSIRLKLSTLDQYMPTIGNDIPLFNMYVKTLVSDLAARGQVTTDLLVNLFKGYNEVNDKNFLRYIQAKEDEYDDGTNINANTLMIQCANKYKILVECGLWNSPSAEEEKILALETKLKAITGRNHNRKRKTKDEHTKLRKPDWMLLPPHKVECDY